MTVGKTYSSISLSEIFSQFSETDVLTSVFPQITSLPCVMSSPLRQDTHPSFQIYVDDNKHVRYKDYGQQDEKGGLLDLLCKYWNCTFRQALVKICEIVGKKENLTFKAKQMVVLTRKEYNPLTKIKVCVRPWKDYDYKYWESYGIDRKWLRHAEIYPISHKIILKKDIDNPTGKAKQYVFSADKYAYCYVERKEGKLSLKIYQPYNTQGYKWCSKMDSSVIGLWTKIPETGDRVVICSSIKDALCLSCQLHIPTLCLQGEGYGMSDTAVNELKRRYKRVYICFDVDKAGLEDGEKLASKTGFINVVPDLGKEKDLSDYYKSLEDKSEFQQLKQLFC